jgi:hypothetical protein
MNAPILRQCKDCGITAELSTFPVSKHLKSGKPIHRWRCMTCQGKWRRDHYPEQVAQYTKEGNAKRRIQVMQLPAHLRRCGRCKIAKELTEFSVSHYAGRLRNLCKSCESDTVGHHEAVRRANRNWEYRLRLKVIAGLGGACECCGETEPHFLSIDHVGGWGIVHRKQMKHKQRKLLSHIIELGFPKDKFQLECWCCHMARHHYGICPHKRFVIDQVLRGVAC